MQRANGKVLVRNIAPCFSVFAETEMFGSVMIERAITSYVRRTAEVKFEPSGLIFTLPVWCQLSEES